MCMRERKEDAVFFSRGRIMVVLFLILVVVQNFGRAKKITTSNIEVRTILDRSIPAMNETMGQTQARSDCHYDESVWPKEFLTPSMDRLMFLEGSHGDSGLAHAFTNFLGLVEAAVHLNLTAQFHYETNGEHHGTNGTQVRNYFFGETMNVPLPNKINRSMCDMVDSGTDFELLKANVLKAVAAKNGETTRSDGWPGSNSTHGRGNLRRRTETEISATNESSMPHGTLNASECTIFKFRSFGLEEKLLSLQRYRKNIFSMFQCNEQTRLTAIQRKEIKPDVIRIAMHIRRGDLFQYFRDQTLPSSCVSDRLISLDAYVSVLKQLFQKLRTLGVEYVQLHVYCEGMGSPFLLPRMDERHYLSLKADLKEFIGQEYFTDLSLFVGEEDDDIQAFDDCCYSHILITGASGFSNLLGYLCTSPIILAMPMFLPFDYMQNAIDLDVQRTTMSLPNMFQDIDPYFTADIITHAQFNESEFDQLWSLSPYYPFEPAA